MKWKSLYLFYSIFCLMSVVCFKLIFVAHKVRLYFHISHVLTRSLLLILHTVISGKAIVNLFSILCGSSNMLAFFRQSQSFEDASGFLTVKTRRLNRDKWSRCRCLGVVLALTNCYAVAVFVYVVNFEKNWSFHLLAAAKVYGFLSAGILLFYDCLPHLILRRCSEVLREYMIAQLESLQSCKGSTPFLSEPEAARQIEKIRLNWCAIRNLKTSINAIWECSLLTSSAGLIIVLCIALYAMFDVGVYRSDVWTVIAYTVYASFAYLDTALLSDAMKHEVRDGPRERYSGGGRACNKNSVNKRWLKRDTENTPYFPIHKGICLPSPT